MIHYSWACIEDDHRVYALTEDSETKDCPICHAPVEPWDDIDLKFIEGVLIRDAAQQMNLDGWPTYFYNITQTAVFHPKWGIKTCAPGDEPGLPGQVPGWDL